MNTITPSQRWRIANRQKCREYCKAYYERNKEVIKLKRRLRYNRTRNPDLILPRLTNDVMS